MARVVIDTNIYCSHLIGGPKNNGIGKALSLAYGYHTPLQSEETFEELKDVLHRPQLEKYISAPDRIWILESIRKNALFIDHNEDLKISPDPKDDKFFQLAKAGGADFILTGDKSDILAIDFPSKPISVREFIDPENPDIANIHKAQGYKWFKDTMSNLFLPKWSDTTPV